MASHLSYVDLVRIKSKTSMEQLNIADLVRELRQELNLSQEKFAVKLGVSLRTVTRWEKGKTKPSPLAMEKITVIQSEISTYSHALFGKSMANTGDNL